MQPQPTQTNHNRQLLVVTGLLLIALIAMAGVFWLQSRQIARNDEIPQPAPSADVAHAASIDEQAASTATKYLDIPEWSVRVPLTDEGGTPEYTLTSQDDGSGAIFISTAELSKIDANCHAASGQLGLLERSKTPLHDGVGAREVLKVIDGYSYYYSGPQALCLTAGETDSTENESLVDTQQTAFAQAVRAITAQ